MSDIKPVKPLIYRFKKGEVIPLTEEDFSGCFAGIARDSGYIFKYSNTYIAVFDSDLHQAPLLAEVSLEAKAIQAEIIREAPEKIDKQQVAYDTIYVCKCENISYSWERYDDWLKKILELKAQDKNIDLKASEYCREVQGDIKPYDWPNRWGIYQCSECKQLIYTIQE